MSRAKKRVTEDIEKKLRNLRPFKPGQSGNPKGRPKGARNRLGTQFLEALETDFNQSGPQAIALVREKKPEVYMRGAWSLHSSDAQEQEYDGVGRGLKTFFGQNGGRAAALINYGEL